MLWKAILFCEMFEGSPVSFESVISMFLFDRNDNNESGSCKFLVKVAEEVYALSFYPNRWFRNSPSSSDDDDDVEIGGDIDSGLLSMEMKNRLATNDELKESLKMKSLR